MKTEAIKIFIAYARKDAEMLEELRKQFIPLEKASMIRVWYDGEIKPGEKWNEKIQKELHLAEIILLLVSPDSIASTYFYESEVEKAMLRNEKGETRVIPVVLRPCFWQDTPIGKLQALPQNGKPIVQYSPIDNGYFNVVESIREIVSDLLYQNKNLKTNSKKVSNGTIEFIDSERNAVSYSGEIFNGKANGFGIGRKLGHGSFYKYEGKYQNNQRHDKKGKILWDSGDRYEGEFQNDKRTGKGVYYWDNGSEYIGDFLENSFTGKGIYRSEDLTYEGELRGLSFHNLGKLIDRVNKFIYEGQFWEGRKAGNGKIVYEDGLIYEGEFLADLFHFHGRRVLPNGVIYEGQFRKGKAHGYGKLFTDRFDIYEGFFIDNKVEIEGIQIDLKGNKLEYNYLGNLNEYKISFYNGDTFQGFKSLSNENLPSKGFRLTGWYTFQSGTKMQIKSSKIEKIVFVNGAHIESLKWKTDFSKDLFFEHFIRYEIQEIESSIYYFTYVWPNGKFVLINNKEFILNYTTGDLLFKNGNTLKG